MSDAVKKLAEAIQEYVQETVEEEIERLANEKVTAAVENMDFSDALESAADEFDFDKFIENALDNYNFDEAIDNAIGNYDFDNVLRRQLREGEFNDSIREAVNSYIADFDGDDFSDILLTVLNSIPGQSALGKALRKQLKLDPDVPDEILRDKLEEDGGAIPGTIPLTGMSAIPAPDEEHFEIVEITEEFRQAEAGIPRGVNRILAGLSPEEREQLAAYFRQEAIDPATRD